MICASVPKLFMKFSEGRIKHLKTHIKKRPIAQGKAKGRKGGGLEFFGSILA